jgi:hypothetical protein
MQVYGMQRLEPSRTEISIRLSNANCDENQNEANGKEEKIVWMQFDMNSDNCSSSIIRKNL